MNETAIIAAILAHALNTSPQKEVSHDKVMQDYQRFLEQLQKNDADEIPSALRPIASVVAERMKYSD